MSNELSGSGSNGIIDIGKIFGSDEQETRPNCKLCNSKNRKEAEAMADKGDRIQGIFQFLKRQGEDISYNAVSNHINYHFKAKQTETDIKEYVNQLSKWSNLSIADETLLTRYIREMDMEIFYLNSKNAGLDHATRLKNNECINKMRAMVLSYKQALKDMNKEMHPVNIIFSSLNRIIEVKLRGAVNPEVKQALRDVIDQLNKEVGDVPIEGKKSED